MLPEPSSFVSLVELHMHRSLSTKEKDLALLLLLILQSLEAPIWLLQGMTRSSKVLGLYCRLVMTTMVDLKVKSMPGAMAVARSTMGEVGPRVLALSRVFRIRVPPLYGVHGGTTVLDEHAMTKFLQQVKGCMINKYAHYLESVLLLFRVLALITCARAGDDYAAVCGSFALYLDLKMQAPERLIDWQFNDLDLFVGSFRAFRRAVANLRAHLPPLRVRRIGRPYQITARPVSCRLLLRELEKRLKQSYMSCPSKGLARGGRAPKESSQAKAQRAAIFSAYECVSNHVERAQWNLPPAEYPPLSLGRRPHELLAVFEITPLHESDVLFPGSPLTGGPINRIQIIVERHRDTLACVEGTLESFDINACKVGFVMPATLRPIFINRTGGSLESLVNGSRAVELTLAAFSLPSLSPLVVDGVTWSRFSAKDMAEYARTHGPVPLPTATDLAFAQHQPVQPYEPKYAIFAADTLVKKIEGAVTRQLVRLEKYLERFPPPSPQPLPSITATAAPSSSGQEAGPSTSTSAIDGYLKRPREDDGLTMQEFFDPSQEAMA